jgi:hypothetical protein
MENAFNYFDDDDRITKFGKDFIDNNDETFVRLMKKEHTDHILTINGIKSSIVNNIKLILCRKFWKNNPCMKNFTLVLSNEELIMIDSDNPFTRFRVLNGEVLFETTNSPFQKIMDLKINSILFIFEQLAELV